MAQVAFVRRLAFCVAIHARHHVRRDFLGVLRVAKEHELRYPVDALPTNPAALRQFGKPLHADTVSSNGLMTEHAMVTVRQAGTLFRDGSLVAVDARHSLVHVQPVVECHWLGRDRTGELLRRRCVESLGLAGQF